MSEVLNILKRRVYFGQEHSTKLPHLQQAEREILDWVDKQTEQAVRELCQRTAIQAGEMLAALATPPNEAMKVYEFAPDQVRPHSGLNHASEGNTAVSEPHLDTPEEGTND